jgi:hypothetical protein
MLSELESPVLPPSVQESMHRAHYPDAIVAVILDVAVDCPAIEQMFHNVKKVHGAGQPQLREFWANIAAWHLTLWLHNLVEVWTWARLHESLWDRRDSSWDEYSPRPSHADRRETSRHEWLAIEFSRKVRPDRFH